MFGIFELLGHLGHFTIETEFKTVRTKPVRSIFTSLAPLYKGQFCCHCRFPLTLGYHSLLTLENHTNMPLKLLSYSIQKPTGIGNWLFWTTHSSQTNDVVFRWIRRMNYSNFVATWWSVATISFEQSDRMASGLLVMCALMPKQLATKWMLLGCVFTENNVNGKGFGFVS